MTVAFESGYTLPSGDLPLNHARVLHDGNRFKVKTVTASSELPLYPGSAANSGDTVDRWRPFANEVTDPSDFSTANWTTTQLTVGSDGQTLTETLATANRRIEATQTFTAGSWVIGFVVERQSVGFVAIVANDGTNTPFVYFDLKNIAVGTSSNPATVFGNIVDRGDGTILVSMRFTALGGTGFIRLNTAAADGVASYTGVGDTIKVKQAIAHPSEATLTYDLFTAQEGDTFAIAAHNLWSSGATVSCTGGNLVDDGGFDVGVSGWSPFALPPPYGGTLVLSGGKGLMTVGGADDYYWETQVFTTVVGRRYKVGGTISNGTGGTLYKIRVGPTADMLAAGGSTLDVQDGDGSGEIIFTASGTTSYVILQVNGTGASAEFDDVFFKEYIAEITPTDNSPIMAFIEPDTRARWEITIIGGALPEIGVFRVGKALQMERPFYGGFTIPRMARNTVVRGNISGSGELLGRSKERTTLRTQYQWQHLTYDWVRANLDGPTGLIQSAESEPVFLAWRPSATQDVDYVMRASTDAPNAMGLRDLWTFGMSGEAHSYE